MAASHILLVDDEEDIVTFMQNFLRRLHISSQTATSGEEALAVYDKDTFGLVFLDIHMEGMDGITVLKKLRERDPEARVIIITGNAEAGIMEEVLAAGATGYISKPLDLAELKRIVQQFTLKPV